MMLLACFAGYCLHSTAEPILDVYDGFESPTLGKYWSSNRFEPGAVTIQTNVARAGRRAVMVTVRPNDKIEAGIKGSKDSERDELLEARELVAKEGLNYEYSFSMFIPTNFPIVPTRLVIAQWKQLCPEGANCDDDSPVVALRYMSGKLYITRQTSAHQFTLFETTDEMRGKWNDFKFQFRFAANETGRVKAWINNAQVADFTGINAYPENSTTGYPSPGYFYFKMGLYRDLMSKPMTLYIDEYRKKQLPENAF